MKKDISCPARAESFDSNIVTALESSKLGKFSPMMAAYIRNLYCDSTGVDIDSITGENINNYLPKIVAFYKTLVSFDKQNINSLRSATKNMVHTYNTLHKVLGAKTLNDRVEAIISTFTDILTKNCEKFGWSREKALHGLVHTNSQGKKVLINTSVLFKFVKNEFAKKYTEALRNWQLDPTNEEKRELVGKWSQFLENYESIQAVAMGLLLAREPIDPKVDYAFLNQTAAEDYLTPDDPRYVDVAEEFDIEASTKEHWQEVNESINAFNSLSKKVRMVISSLPARAFHARETDNDTVTLDSTEEKDNLGIEKHANPVKVYQHLQNSLKYMQSSEDMMDILDALKNTYDGYGKLYDILSKNKALRSEFYVNLNKTFERFRQHKENRDGTQTPQDLNVILRDQSYSRWAVNIITGNYNPAKFIYAEGNEAVLKQFRNSLYDNLVREEKIPDIFGGIKKVPSYQVFNEANRKAEQKITKLTEWLEALGITVSSNEIVSLVKDKERRPDLYKLLNALRDFAGEVENTVDVLRDNKQQDAIKNITRIVYGQSITEDYRTRIRRGDSTFNSFVNPSFLSDLIDDILRFVSRAQSGEEDADEVKEELRRYINDLYMTSPYFNNSSDPQDTSKPLNKWLQEILDSDLTDTQSFAAQLKYYRLLGTVELDFEDFASSHHRAEVVTEYFSYPQKANIKYVSEKEFAERLQAKENGTKIVIDGKSFEPFQDGQTFYIEGSNYGYKVQKGGELEAITRTDYANYPIFVLGDAGVSKSITGRRYTEREILDSMYNTYLAERNKVQMLLKAKKRWVEEEHRPLEDFLHIYENAFDKNGNFSYKNGVLNFLPNEAVNGEPLSEEAFKEKAVKYLNGLAAKHFENFVKDGVFSFNGERCVKSPIGLSDKEKNLAAVQEKMRLFSWNITHAFIQQFQVLTIDTQFYESTKDLQKRYKETHAPGTPLDLYRQYEDGSYVMADPITGMLNTTERFAYFQDINVNAEETDPYFMQSVLRYFAKVSPEEVNQAINNGVCKPIKNNSDAEAQRIERLKSLLGSNYKNYEVYRKNTLTDGQGFRTLESYRKVLLCAGKWNLGGKEEQLYKIIQQYRKNVRENSEWKDTQEAKDMLAKASNLQVALQPIKPYLFGFEKYGLGDEWTMNIPVQHKYAEVVLIPELMRDSKLKDMALWMEEHKVDMMGTTKIAKVGSYGQAHIDTTNTTKSLEEALNKAIVHEIDYKWYRIQTNVPEHVNSSGLFGTQARKIFFKSIDKTRDYSHYLAGLPQKPKKIMLSDGKEVVLGGNALIQFYNNLICANLWDSYERITKRVTDPAKLQEDMAYNITMNDRQSKDNLLGLDMTDDGKFIMPLCEVGWEFDTSAMMFSWFKKKVLKQKIKAGSAVQASALGLTKLEEDSEDTGGLQMVYDKEGNPIAAQCELTWDFSYVTSSGESVNLDFTDYCNEEGYLLNENNQPITDLTKVDDSKLNKEFPGILDMITYRIPTENQYSIIALKACRFTPKSAQGGTIKVPAHFTTIAGFDFDIDKLYFIRKEFKERRPQFENLPISEEDKQRIFEKIQQEHPNFIKQVSAITEESFSDEQLYDIFAQIYADERSIYDDLQRLRPENSKTPLNRYFEDSPEVKRKAVQKGFEDVKEYKQFLVNQAAATLGYIPETVKTVKDGYLTFDKEAISKAGLTLHKLLRETGESLGIKMSQQVKPKNEIERFQTYDFSKKPQDNSVVARNNMILYLYQQRLADPETFRERYVAGGFPECSKSAKMFRVLEYDTKTALEFAENGSIDLESLHALVDPRSYPDPEPNYDANDFDTLIYYNQQNQLAAKLIGIFANQNTNAAFCQILDSLVIRGANEDPTKRILFGSLLNAQAYDLQTGKEVNKILGQDIMVQAVILDNGEVRNANMVVEFLAASVDAVKDPVLKYLNLNILTADTAGLLARMGYSTDDIGGLLNQPIIKQICEYSQKSGITDINSCINTILTNSAYGYSELAKTVDTETLNQNPTLGQLAYNIAEYNKAEGVMSDEMKLKQLGVLELFKKVNSVAGALSKFVTNSKFTAANAVGSDWGSYYEKIQRVQNYFDSVKDSPIELSLTDTPLGAYENDAAVTVNDALLGLSKDEYLATMSTNPFAFEQTIFDLLRKFTKEIQKYYPYETPTYKEARTFIASMNKKGWLDADTINLIHRELPVYLLSKLPNSQFNGELPYGLYDATTGKIYFDLTALETNPNLRIISNREYFLEIFPKQFAEYSYRLRNEGATDEMGGRLSIFNYLRALYDTKNGRIKLNLNDALGLQSLEQDVLKSSWSEMDEVLSDLLSEEGHPVDVKIANDLFMHFFYRAGLTPGPQSAMNIAPVDLKTKIIVSDNPITVNGEEHYLTYTEWYQGVAGANSSESLGLLNGGCAQLFDPVEFFELLCLNHPDNTTLVFKAKDKQVNNLKTYFYEGEAVKDKVDIQYSEKDTKLKDIIINVDKESGEVTFKPVLNLNGNMFIIRSDNKDTYNKSQTGSVTYYRVDALGTANGGLTYGNKASLIQTTEDKAALAEPEEGQEDSITKRNAENVYDDYSGDSELEQTSIEDLWGQLRTAVKVSGMNVDILTTHKPTRKSEMIQRIQEAEESFTERLAANKRRLCK